MSAPIQFEATLDSGNRRKDRSVSIKLTSMREMTTEEFAEIDRRMGDAGWVLFAPNELAEADIPKEPAEDTSKTPSQRLRNVLFVYWQQLGCPGDFEQFYKAGVEKAINNIKEKLEPTSW